MWQVGIMRQVCTDDKLDRQKTEIVVEWSRDRERGFLYKYIQMICSFVSLSLSPYLILIRTYIYPLCATHIQGITILRRFTAIGALRRRVAI